VKASLTILRHSYFAALRTKAERAPNGLDTYFAVRGGSTFEAATMSAELDSLFKKIRGRPDFIAAASTDLSWERYLSTMECEFRAIYAVAADNAEASKVYHQIQGAYKASDGSLADLLGKLMPLSIAARCVLEPENAGAWSRRLSQTQSLSRHGPHRLSPEVSVPPGDQTGQHQSPIGLARALSADAWLFS
jgi:hypothetical protein